MTGLSVRVEGDENTNRGVKNQAAPMELKVGQDLTVRQSMAIKPILRFSIE